VNVSLLLFILYVIFGKDIRLRIFIEADCTIVFTQMHCLTVMVNVFLDCIINSDTILYVVIYFILHLCLMTSLQNIVAAS